MEDDGEVVEEGEEAPGPRIALLDPDLGLAPADPEQGDLGNRQPRGADEADDDDDQGGDITTSDNAAAEPNDGSGVQVPSLT